jgi:hypothetical protein
MTSSEGENQLISLLLVLDLAELRIVLLKYGLLQVDKIEKMAQPLIIK